MKTIIKSQTAYFPAADGYRAGDTVNECIEAEFKPRYNMEMGNSGEYVVTTYTEIDPTELAECVDDDEREDLMAERTYIPEFLSAERIKTMYGYIRHRK